MRNSWCVVIDGDAAACTSRTVGRDHGAAFGTLAGAVIGPDTDTPCEGFCVMDEEPSPGKASSP